MLLSAKGIKLIYNLFSERKLALYISHIEDEFIIHTDTYTLQIFAAAAE